MKAVTLLATSKCSLNCEHCNQKEWRREANYEMSLEEVDLFIKVTEDSNYQIPFVTIAGGEPTLWGNLLECARRLKASKAIEIVELVTNCMAYEKTVEVSALVDRIRLSYYGKNKDNVSRLSKDVECDVVVNDMTKFVPRPDSVVFNSVPGVCACDKYTVLNKRIYLCSGVYELSRRFSSINPELYSVELAPGYADKLGVDAFGKIAACAVCTNNCRIVNQLGKVENRV